MRRIELIEDVLNGVATYEMPDGQWMRFDARMVHEYGLERCLQMAGYEPPTGRLPVFQRGRKIGTVPATFDPIAVKSSSPFYEPRGDDFKREGDTWMANEMLGPGDLEAVPGFVWDRG